MSLLAGHRALVTGGASGIGLAVCKRFVAEGAKVALLDIDAAGAETAAAEIGAFAVTADVGSAEQTERAIRAAAERLEGLSILVNNAGTSHLALLHETSLATWESLMRVNLTGVYHAMRVAIPLMLAGGHGAIVNNSSGSGPRPTRGESAYSAAKAGVIALTQGAAQEYGPVIRVNAVSPGVIRTPMSELLFRRREVLEPVLAATPLARTGTAEDVANVILFLASDLSAFMTGQNLVVDGGMGLPQAGIDQVLKSMFARKDPK